MAAMIEQGESANVAVFRSVDYDDLTPRSHVVFANAVVCSMCDEFNVYWEPEVPQGYRNFCGLARHARISDAVLQAIRILFLDHGGFEKTAEEVAMQGFEPENLSKFIENQVLSLYLKGRWNSRKAIMYVLACVTGVCISLYRIGCDFAPSVCAVKLAKMMYVLDKEWKGQLYTELDDFARSFLEKRQSQCTQESHQSCYNVMFDWI